jgi:predicted permease
VQDYQEITNIIRGRLGGIVEALRQDLIFAVRSFRNQKSFAIAVVLAIALGIGATTAVFSVVDRILFRSLPYPDADRLVTLGFVAPIEPNEFILAADYLEWRERQTSFASVASFTGVRDCDLTESPAVRLGCAQVEHTFLQTLGIQPVLGRNFTREEDRAGAPPVALLSFSLWRSRFGGNPRLVGQTLSLDGRPTTIVGVLPAAFELPTLASADLIVPQALDESAMVRTGSAANTVLRAFARLKQGISIQQAKAALEPLFTESLRFVPPAFRREVSLSVRSLRDRQIQDARMASWTLLAAVLAVLLIACANTANLMLVRLTGRRRELALRTAMGASRGRIMRQLLTESLFLALVGGTLGCGLAYYFLRVFIAVAPEGILRLHQATLDSRVLLFTAVTSVLSGLLFGVASAHRETAAEALQDRGSSVIGRAAFRRLMVSAQVAIAFMLLTGAGLLLRSLDNLQRVPLGLDSSGVVTAEIVVNPRLYSQPVQRLRFFEALEREMQHLPGVTFFALADSLPPSGRTRASIYAGIQVEGHERTAQGTGGMVIWRSVTPGYFSALGIPIRRGRGFSEDDRRSEINVVVLSSSLARRLFPNEDPLGKTVRFAQDRPWHTVIGIAGDTKNAGIAETPEPEYYVARKHSPDEAWAHSTLILRTALNPAAVDSWIRSAAASLDPGVPVKVETLTRRLRQLEVRPRFNALLLSIFAAMGLMLAAIGTYGVLAFVAAQRTREMGVRIALGAQPGDILKLVVGQGIRWTLGGMTAGLAGALVSTRWMSSLLFGVAATDPMIMATAAAVMVFAAVLASFIPARRATRVDPMETLRSQ